MCGVKNNNIRVTAFMNDPNYSKELCTVRDAKPENFKILFASRLAVKKQ